MYLISTDRSQKQRDIAARTAIANGGGPREEGEPFPRDGSTATILLVVRDKLFVANCGDSEGDRSEALILRMYLCKFVNAYMV